jgi:hypothetical protein
MCFVLTTAVWAKDLSDYEGDDLSAIEDEDESDEEFNQKNEGTFNVL